MVAPAQITQSSVALKIPITSELVEGGLAVNVIDGALYSARHDGSVIRIEGDTGNGTIASAVSIALGAVMAGVVDVTGTTTITAILLREGQTRTVRFTGALTLTNSTGLVLPGGANIVTVAGDYATFRGYAAGVTRCTNYSFIAASSYALLGGSSSQAFLTAALTASGAVTGSKFQTATASAAVPTGVATTLYTLPNAPPAVYLVSVNIGAVGDAVNYGASAVVLVDGATARLVWLNNGPLQTITLVGLSIKTTQSSGLTQTANITLTKIG